MPKLKVVSNDGGKTLEINTVERRDVITFNESETIVKKGNNVITITH